MPKFTTGLTFLYLSVTILGEIVDWSTRPLGQTALLTPTLRRVVPLVRPQALSPFGSRAESEAHTRPRKNPAWRAKLGKLCRLPEICFPSHGLTDFEEDREGQSQPDNALQRRLLNI